MNNPRHLGGDGDGCLAPQILVLAVFGNMPAEAIAQTIVALANRDLGGQPKGSTQACVAVLRQACLPAKLSGLMCREIEPTELEKLTMMPEAP
jgi:hypothetical protein